MTVEEIIEEYDLKSKCRKRELVFMRYVLYKYLRSLGLSFDSIGKYFNRDHSTVIHGIKEYNLMSEHRYRNLDFDKAKEIVCNNLGLTAKLKPKAQVSYLENKVLDCNNLKELLELKEEIRKTLEEREEENIFTTFDI